MPLVSRYFVGSAGADFHTAANWSVSSGGAGGAGVPSTGNLAVFDASSPASCIASVSVNVGGVRFTGGYAGNFRCDDDVFIYGDTVTTALDMDAPGATSTDGMFPVFQIINNKRLYILGTVKYRMPGAWASNKRANMPGPCLGPNADLILSNDYYIAPYSQLGVDHNQTAALWSGGFLANNPGPQMRSDTPGTQRKMVYVNLNESHMWSSAPYSRKNRFFHTCTITDIDASDGMTMYCWNVTKSNTKNFVDLQDYYTSSGTWGTSAQV
jgi:hypothetical protein